MMAIISDIMSKEVYVVGPEDNLAHVRNLFMKKKISRVLVYKDRPLGIITEKDIVNVFSRERREIDAVKANEIMKPNVIAVLPDEKPEMAAKIMVSKNISSLPVVSKNEVLGIITKTDLAEYFSENYYGKTAVSDIMEQKVPTAKEFQSVFHAAKLMKDADHLVVLRDKKIVGIVSERDLSLLSYGARPTKITFFKRGGGTGLFRQHDQSYPLVIADLMNERVETIDKHMDAAEAAAKMVKNKIGSLVVKHKDGTLAGILTKLEILKYLAGRTN